MIYVALLRGINVGGNNKVDMKKLKTTFESLGFQKVVTYINSGNIVFEEKSSDRDKISTKIEKAIKKDFQLDIKVLIRDFNNIQMVCKELPSTWVKNEVMRTDVMFLWEEVDSADILQKLPIYAVDNIKYVPGAVLWNIMDENYNKSGMHKIIGTKIYKSMTIRNVNTVRKLFQIMSEL